MDKSFQIIRTNPRLTTNVKIVVNSDDNIYLESFNSSKELSDQKYKHVLLNRECLIEDEMPKFYDSLPKKIAFSPKSELDVDVMYDAYENQFDNTYYSGANEVEDQWYEEEFEYFAPLYIKKNNIPSKFMIMRVDDAAIYELDGQDYALSNLNTENFRSEIIDKWKCATVFDLTDKTNIGKYFNRNINENDRFPEFSFFFDTKKYNYSKWAGMSYSTGVYTSSELFLDDKLYYENKHFNLEEFITKGFEENDIIYPYIHNMKFLFDDEPGTPDKFNKYSMNRYYGFYADDFELVKTVSSYPFEDIIVGINNESINSSITIKNNIFIQYGEPVNPFVNKSVKEEWIQYKNSFYKVKKLSNDSFKIISDIDLTGVDTSELNNGFCSIEYTTKNNIIFYNEFNIDDYINSDGEECDMYADLYLIEIDGLYHVLKKVGDEYIIHTDYAITSDKNTLRYWKGGQDSKFDTTRNVFDDSGNPIQYNIYRVKFTDIKDFDFDRINTKYSDFDYEKSTYHDTPEIKLIANEYRDSSVPLRKKLHDVGEDGQYKKMNISSEYSAGDETFELQNNNLISIWEKNQSICKWTYNDSISHSDYPYKLNNSNTIGGVYNRTVNTTCKSANVKEKTLDYFYRIGDLFSKDDDMFLSSGSLDETTWDDLDPVHNNIINNNTEIYLNHQHIPTETSVNVSYEYLGKPLVENGLYNVKFKMKIINVNDDLNNDIPFSAGVDQDESFLDAIESSLVDTEIVFDYITRAQGTKFKFNATMCDAYFYDIEINHLRDNYYINQSTNIQTSLHEKFESNNKTAYFNLNRYLDAEIDYFDFFFNNNMYTENFGKKSKKRYKKYSIFNGGDSDLPATALFKGIEYSLYSVEDMVLNGEVGGKETIRNVITQGGEKFNGYKISVISSEIYNDCEFTTNDGEYTFVKSIKNENRSISNVEKLNDFEKTGIHVIVNEKFKNVLIIVNILIPINVEWYSLNNVEIFGENHGLYYGKTKDDKYSILPSNDGTVDEYDPNKITAYNYIKALNNLNTKPIFDTLVSYYYVDKEGVFGKTKMTDFNSSSSSILGLTDWNNKFPPFIITLDSPTDIELKKKSYNTTSIKGPETNIYDKYLVYSSKKPLLNSFINQPLSRSITINKTDDSVNIINHGERINNTTTIKRFVGYYEPIFTDITMFNPSYYWCNNDECDSFGNNYVFSDKLENFGRIEELMYSKVNDEENTLKLRNVDDDKSVYPMVDEVGLSQTNRNILLSSWDKEFYIKTLNEQTLLEDYIEIPIFVIQQDVSFSIINVSVGSLTNSNIYGLNKSNELSGVSNKMDITVTIKNNSEILATAPVSIKLSEANKPLTGVLASGTINNIPANSTGEITFTINKPTERKNGYNNFSYTEFTKWNIIASVDDNTGGDSNSDTFVNVYNDIIGFDIIDNTTAQEASQVINADETNNYEYTLNETFNKVSNVSYKSTFIIYANDTNRTQYEVGTVTGTVKDSKTVIFTDVLLTLNTIQGLMIPVGNANTYLTKIKVEHFYTIEGVTKSIIKTYSERKIKLQLKVSNLSYTSEPKTSLFAGTCNGKIYSGDKINVQVFVKNNTNSVWTNDIELNYTLYRSESNIVSVVDSYYSATFTNNNIAIGATKMLSKTLNSPGFKSLDVIHYFFRIKSDSLVGTETTPKFEGRWSAISPCSIKNTGGSGGGCVDETSPVTLTNGKTIQIKDIKVGDKVLSCNINNIWTESKEWTGDVYKDSKPSESIVTHVEKLVTPTYYNINDGLIKMTGSHVILIKDLQGIWRWITGDELKIGYSFFTEERKEIKIYKIVHISELLSIVKLDVESVDNYFTCGILSHNKQITDTYIDEQEQGNKNPI